jgi:hypothetical protein
MWIGERRKARGTDDTTDPAALNLRYSGQRPVKIRGAITGRSYQFSPQEPVQPVELKDAVFLLAGRSFRIA